MQVVCAMCMDACTSTSQRLHASWMHTCVFDVSLVRLIRNLKNLSMKGTSPRALHDGEVLRRRAFTAEIILVTAARRKSTFSHKDSQLRWW